MADDEKIARYAVIGFIILLFLLFAFDDSETYYPEDCVEVWYQSGVECL